MLGHQRFLAAPLAAGYLDNHVWRDPRPVRD
jgi:hypothetical protein